ncbi:MAG: N-acetylmuramoyl-L-alanine amidase [Elusimicrobia bacterium]|nr:N-acetylmuramoyl-L-alanine amidase [Elusimicrobiota bacterium]
MPKPKLDIPIDLTKSRPWKGIVWHHSVTADDPGLNWDAIVRFHTSYRIDGQIVTADEFERRMRLNQGKSFLKPWKDVGYHGGTEWANGQVIFHWGRLLGMIGAHAGVKGASNQFNEQYLGLCAVGNFDLAPPKPKHWDFNLRLTRAFMEAFQIPASHVIGHREVFDRLGVPRQKSCPGNRWDMELFRAELV